MTAFLDYASSKYYAGDPIISDEEFDRLAEFYDYKSVGAAIQGDSIAHAFPMWSLQKVYDDEELITYKTESVWSDKLDGAAISILYCYGRLSLALTRGDGKEGLDITRNIKTLVPTYQEGFSKLPQVQITGEVVAPKHIENARNYAAGALSLKNVDEFKTRDLTFIAYGVFPYEYSFWTDDMRMLEELGFNTVIGDSWEQFPKDGRVCRIDHYEAFALLGYTSKHPRGAFALKERKGGVITRLIDVEWQPGRSGVISPVAILEPVNIGGATVSRATLHNIKYIREKDLDYGCLVEVIRSGEIIPRVVRRIYEK